MKVKIADDRIKHYLDFPKLLKNFRIDLDILTILKIFY